MAAATAVIHYRSIPTVAVEFAIVLNGESRFVCRTIRTAMMYTYSPGSQMDVKMERYHHLYYRSVSYDGCDEHSLSAPAHLWLLVQEEVIVDIAQMIRRGP